MPVTEDAVFTALRECYDPEIPVNIVDLGLIYAIRVVPPSPAEEQLQDVQIVMTMTSPGCPAHATIGEDVRGRVGQIPGVREVSVEVVWTPAWTPERLSSAARKQLGIE